MIINMSAACSQEYLTICFAIKDLENQCYESVFAVVHYILPSIVAKSCNVYGMYGYA